MDKIQIRVYPSRVQRLTPATKIRFGGTHQRGKVTSYGSVVKFLLRTVLLGKDSDDFALAPTTQEFGSVFSAILAWRKVPK
jgi:hypothetical protein